ncbi:MAG: rhomboid family intramembrane serine protease [Cyanobacteria bacterium P01_F01_bin.53]
MFNRKVQSLLLWLILGGFALALYTADPRWQPKADVLRDGLILAWIASLINMFVLGNGLGRLLGIRPRRVVGLLGIFFSPFLHRDLNHLMANTVPFLVLGWLVLLQDEVTTSTQGELPSGDGRFYAVTVVILLIGGLGTWFLGRQAIHIGASGLIFGYIGFLLVSSYTGPTLVTVGFALVVLVLYGQQLWGMMPLGTDKRVSWEGHLFGFVGGVTAGLRPDFLSAFSTVLNQLG